MTCRRLTRAGVAVAVAVLALAGCGVTGTVVDKGFRTTPIRTGSKTTQYQPCWWVKVRDDSGKTHTACTSNRAWKKPARATTGPADQHERRPGGCTRRGVWVAPIPLPRRSTTLMTIIHLSPVGGEEPTAADLAAIDREMPLIEAEMNLLDAEIALDNAGPDALPLARRRVRRAERRVLEVTRKLANREPETEDAA
ncbi:DUF6284 family protein [Kribbella sp. NPDC051137]|uniref:DUF6284 family protein n=1 Tax=Kribbella sp. NPDC051137 TaxID=3155045 RepID=UPI003438A16F